MLIQTLIPMLPWALGASWNPYSTFARSVESGMLPCTPISQRAISDPPSRPASWILIPFAPLSIVVSMCFFIARRNPCRFARSSPIASATSCGSGR